MSDKSDKPRMNTARVDDGWRYVVLLQGGQRFELWDHDRLEAVLARWDEALGRRLTFSGAAAKPSTPPEAAGAVRASEILAIREYSIYVDDEGRDAFLAAHAALKDAELEVFQEKVGGLTPGDEIQDGEIQDGEIQDGEIQDGEIQDGADAGVSAEPTPAEKPKILSLADAVTQTGP